MSLMSGLIEDKNSHKGFCVYVVVTSHTMWFGRLHSTLRRERVIETNDISILLK